MKRRGKRRERVVRDDRVGPTPETEAKLIPDPFNVLVQHGLLDTAQRDAGLEVRAIWYAITGGLMPKAGERSSARSGDGMSEELALAHANVYLPWCMYWGRLVEEVIDLVVDAQLPAACGYEMRFASIQALPFTIDDLRPAVANIGSMLEDYAKRRRTYGRMKRAA